MGIHIHKQGKNIIRGISVLGSYLGYFAIEEFPVKTSYGKQQKIDVAWVYEDDHEYPLMIFEIESKITSSSSNNPVKIFGHPDDTYERPLFYFHLFIKGSKVSAKIKSLEKLFGSYNYRTYDLSIEDEKTKLLIDIVSQHRRINSSLNIHSIIQLFSDPIWSQVDQEKVLCKIESLKFKSNFLKSYAKKTLENIEFKKHYLRFLALYVCSEDKIKHSNHYGTFWGDEWQEAIHYGMLIRFSTEVNNAYEKEFIRWFKSIPLFKNIELGLRQSREWDEFMICMAPAFWAFISALLKSSKNAIESLLVHYEKVQLALQKWPPNLSFFNSLWMLHVASELSFEKEFRLAKNFINERGGISPKVLFCPPSTIPLDGSDFTENDYEWVEKFQEKAIKVPSLKQFVAEKRKNIRLLSIENCDDYLFNFAMDVLLNPGVHSDWSKRIICSLKN